MPCSDGGNQGRRDWERFEAEGQNKRIKFLDASLCAALTTLENDLHEYEHEVGVTIFDDFDFKESGITKKQLSRWWEEHKMLDCARKLEEGKAAFKKAAKKIARKEALEKLTPEDIKALGINTKSLEI